MNTGLPNANPGGNKGVTLEFLDQNQNGLFDGVGELGERIGGSPGTGLGIERSAPVGTPVDPNTVVPHVDEYSLSGEHQVGADLGLRLSVVHKRQTGGWGRGGAMNIAQTRATLTNVQQVPCPAACESAGYGGATITVNGLPDGASRSENIITNFPAEDSNWNWTTVSLGVNRRFRNNFFWNAYFDYQWRHEGRRASQTTSPLATDPINEGWEAPVGTVSLLQDLTNWQFKAAGRYVLPYDIGTATTFRLVSGFPWAPMLSIAVPNVGSRLIFLDDLNNRRSDTVSILDLRVDKEVVLGDSANIQFIFDVFNALNNASETNFIMRAGSAYRNTIEWIQGRTIGLSARLTF